MREVSRVQYSIGIFSSTISQQFRHAMLFVFLFVFIENPNNFPMRVKTKVAAHHDGAIIKLRETVFASKRRITQSLISCMKITELWNLLEYHDKTYRAWNGIFTKRQVIMTENNEMFVIRLKLLQYL